MPNAGLIARLRLIALCGLVALLAATGTVRAATLYQFNGNPSGCNPCDGAEPYAGLTMVPGGHFLFGMTSYGGSNGQGTVFELSQLYPGPWAESVLYNFCPPAGCADGSQDAASPRGGLVVDGSGYLYGATANGTNGNGTVFELTPAPTGGHCSGSHQGNGWCESVLYSFGASGDGRLPQAGLVPEGSGSLHGTTDWGGGAACASPGCGTVFMLTRNPNPSSGARRAAGRGLAC